MKNILVLTDFSAAAMRAGESALPLAAKLGADVLLVNVYPITPYLPPAGLAEWPVTWPVEKKRESSTKLNLEARRLEKRLRALKLPAHKPLIRPMSLEGRLAERVAGLAGRKNGVLIIMGVSAGSYGDLLFDGDVKAVLQQVTCPVLVVPANWRGAGIRHILYASDLATADERVIAALVSLAGRLKARLSLSHVSRPVLIPDFAEEVRTSAFIEKIRDLYPAIGFYPARDTHILGALEEMSAEKHADVIALRYQQHAIWYRLFHENPLKEAIEQREIPLLIFPENTHGHE